MRRLGGVFRAISSKERPIRQLVFQKKIPGPPKECFLEVFCYTLNQPNNIPLGVLVVDLRIEVFVSFILFL